MTADAALTPAEGDARYVGQSLGPVFAAASGTPDRSTFATYTAPTVSNTYTQAEVQAIAAAAQINSQHLKAMIDDLRANKALSS